MSWWNTGNITNLASQALKNAQKKIDKALDIGAQSGGQQQPAAENIPQQKEAGREGENVNTWLGDSAESGSSWSFPWTAGDSDTKQGSPDAEVREKTAEEIKSEVLKAAKERTKAKSKLFAPKLSDTHGSIKNSSRIFDAETKTHALSTDDEPHTPVKYTEIVDLSTSSDDRTNDGDSERLAKKEGISVQHSETGNKAMVESCTTIQDKASHRQAVQGTERQSEDVAKLEVSVSEHLSTSSTGTVLNLSDRLTADEMTGSQAYLSDNSMSGSSFHELNEEDASSQGLTELCVDVQDEHSDAQTGDQQLSRTSSYGMDLLIVSKSDDGEECDSTEIPQLSQTGPHVSGTDDIVELNKGDNEQLPDSTESSDNESESTCDKQAELFADISSSIEVILEQDIDMGNNKSDICGVCDKSDADISTGDSKNTRNESDEIVINEVNDTSKKAIHSKQYSELSDLTPHDPMVEVVEGICGEKDATVGDKYPNVSDSMLHSDSESSLCKHDLSMDTSCSDETVTAESGVSDLVSCENEKEAIECPVVQHHNDNTLESHETIDAETGCIHEKDGKYEFQNTEFLEPDNILQISSKDELSDPNEYEKAELSPANSYVKCMLEDAIDDGKHDDNSDSHSGTGKSDGSRSVISSHESGDEIDTTTSSDIEIISLPTPNGENRLVSPVDPVPLRLALQKTSWHGSPSHRRSDSSGSSNNSRDGVGEMSPGRDFTDHDSHGQYQEGMRQAPELPALSEEDDNPYHPQRLLNDCDSIATSCDHTSSHDQEATNCSPLHSDLNEKLAEMSAVLQAREDKLLLVSKDNCDLMETNSILINQLKQSEEAREAEMTDINELTAEFTQRLTDAEKRVSQAIKEKEQVKRQLVDARTELTRHAEDVSLKQLLEERDEQIAGLLHEGEKLSKSQLQSNTIIKKLRSKEKDNEAILTTQKKKLEQQTEELDHLHRVLESKEALEKKQTEAISQLNAAVSKQEQELSHFKSENEDGQEKMRGLQAALDNSYKEMAELHRTNVVQDSKAHEAALSAEMHVRDELQMALDKQRKQHAWDRDSLLMQMEDVQMSMARMDKDHNRREDLLRQEIADLQKQLQEDEARTQELTHGVSSATRPLLRQIENLQSTYNAQSSTWERVEKNLADRLVESQSQLAMTVEKERSTSEQLMTLTLKVTSLEAQTVWLRQEKSQLTAQTDMLQARVDMYEDTKQTEAAHVEVLKNQMTLDMAELRKQKVMLETQLDVEKSRVDQERKKVALLQEQMRDTEHELQMLRVRGTPTHGTPSPVSISRQDSMVASFHDQSFTSLTQDDFDRSVIMPSPNGNKQSLYEALRQNGAANLLENLQSQLKQREGEITHLQGEIQQLERTRESMARELVDLSNQNDDLTVQVADIPDLQASYKELSERYQPLLQMYGEKVEEANELRLDLQDVKDMYKSQINHLLAQ